LIEANGFAAEYPPRRALSLGLRRVYGSKVFGDGFFSFFYFIKILFGYEI
jgi:hypothetical protein